MALARAMRPWFRAAAAAGAGAGQAGRSRGRRRFGIETRIGAGERSAASANDPLADAADAITSAAGPWLAEKLTTLLVSFGIPGGMAGALGAAIVWLVMRRGKQRLQAELERLKPDRSEPADTSSAAPAADAAVVERHHNRYVPYEATALDKAWASAHARVGEKYPGAVPYLKIVEGVKDQLLSGIDEPQIS